MKLVKEPYIHNRLIFEQSERSVLCSTINIISKVRDSNNMDTTKDPVLDEVCNRIINDIRELLANYSNEYPDKCE